MDEYESESGIGRFAVPKFNGSDYRRWSAKMRAALMGIGAWRIITGDVKYPGESALSKELQSYQRVNEKGFALIYTCLEERYQMLLDDETCCNAAWKLLKDNFDMDSRARLVRQLDEFFKEFKFEPGEETIDNSTLIVFNLTDQFYELCPIWRVTLEKAN
ncbi:hypothetical protein JTE90_023077 [Oedothorax gibbosus]|uniref:DUF4219 domain-containing protein n=1 Tax=Oedothorax gibbosus TaxID=931172 RepID=A0AAV6UY13_9ARAC|nr:hypothetical protein JTE90_023077 [Oedothorax gibbosus]